MSGTAFLTSLACAHGVLCGAGFETPAEALHLGKKLLVVPMKQQYEQQGNAAALAALGVLVVRSLRPKHLDRVAGWLRRGQPVSVHYPDRTGAALDQLLHEQLGASAPARSVAT